MAMRQWLGLPAASLVLALSSVINGLKAPVLIGCVFVHKANVTCTWEPGHSQTTHYTLNVQRMNWTEKFDDNGTTFVPERLWACSTTNTSCTIEFTSKVNETLRVNYNFCVSITANSYHGDVTSKPRCQPGINEVLLPPVQLVSITTVAAKPQCLILGWKRNPGMFLISTSQIKNGYLESQIEFRAHTQPHKQVNVNVTNTTFEACVFSPDTLYAVRLRHRYQSRTSPWSQWSNEREGKTAEGAPSAAPMFWRKVLHQDEHRLTSLRWKALPHSLANGRVLSYDVMCRDENAEVLHDQGNCSNVNVSHTSCILNLPLGSCSCSISASTSVGTSPRALIWFSKVNEKVGPAPSQLSVSAVDERSLELKWAPVPASASVSGFVVEWFDVTQKNDSQPHWEQVNGSTTTLNITEGVEPFQRYAVSVRALYGKKGAGESKTEFVYTRQGVPSAGPNITDLKISGSTVTLSWSLPVDKQCGFVRSYTLFYRMSHQQGKSVDLPGSVEHHSLSLSPGHYEFRVQARTEAGPGKPGAPYSAHIGQEEMSIVLYILFPIGLISLTLIMTIFVAQSRIVKGKLCQEIPDPSQSSMADWSPKTMMGMNFTQPGIQFSEVILLNNRENCESDEDIDLQMAFSPSMLSHYNPFKCDTAYQTSARATDMDTNFSSCSVSYPVARISNEQSSSLSELHHHSYPNLLFHRQPQEGGSELCLFNAQQGTDPFSSLTCVASQSQKYHVKDFSSTPLLQSDCFFQTETLQQNTCVSQLPFPDALPIDLISLLQSPIQCDPYIPL